MKVVLYRYSGATGVWVFYRGRIKLTAVDADDLGMINLFGGQCDWRRPW